MPLEEVKRPRADVGVVIGRFQINELHDAHRELIQTVLNNHDRVIVFLGLSQVRNTKNNPLDFKPRQAMFQEEFPDVEVFYIDDVRDDDVWSKNLDGQIQKWLNPGQTVSLYGSRDSFIKHYRGRFPVVELESKTIVSGTEIRAKIMNKYGATKDFRAGMIYAAGSRYPTAFPTVDIVVFDREKNAILLARKQNETELRFIGGFVDPRDESFEAAALRELREETGGNLEVSGIKYIGNGKVDDFRYRGEVDKVFTTFYIVERVYGSIQPTDDIIELRWIDFVEFKQKYTEILVPEHIFLGKMLLNYLIKE
jgi:bifunctional NMN adenylyltransferase/nudix hydrolase